MIRNSRLPINVYMFATLLTIILWIPFPETCHFLGASSLIYAFLFAVGSNNSMIAVLALLWIPLLGVNLIIWFVYAMKKHVSFPFIITVGSDLLISLLIIFSKVYSENYTDLGITITGYVIRLTFFCWMVYEVRESNK